VTNHVTQPGTSCSPLRPQRQGFGAGSGLRPQCRERL